MAAAFTLVLGLLVLLAVPLDIAFAVHRRAEFGGGIILSWLFGLARMRLAPSRPRKEHRPRKPNRRKKRSAKSHLVRGSLTVLKSAALRRRVLRFVVSVFQSFRMRDLAVRVRLGLDDPADTGRLWGLAGPGIAFLEARTDADIDLQLSFLDAGFEAEARGTVRVIPLHLACVVLIFALSPAVLSAASMLLFGGRR